MENVGNDDVINTIIRDNIPNNTDYLTGTVEVPAGVTATYDEANFQFTFDVDDTMVTIDAAPFKIRFKVQVAQDVVR